MQFSHHGWWGLRASLPPTSDQVQMHESVVTEVECGGPAKVCVTVPMSWKPGEGWTAAALLGRCRVRPSSRGLRLVSTSGGAMSMFSITSQRPSQTACRVTMHKHISLACQHVKVAQVLDLLPTALTKCLQDPIHSHILLAGIHRKGCLLLDH